jgi:hypothetical protein
MNDIAVPGLAFHSIEEVDLSAPALDATCEASRFEIELDGVKMRLSYDEVGGKIEEFKNAEEFPVDVKKKRKIKRIDLSRSIPRIEARRGEGSRTVVTLEMTHDPGHYVKPEQALGFILDHSLEIGEGVRIDRTKLLLVDAVAELVVR